MAFIPAGFIDGTTVPAEMLRRQTWAASSGSAGVLRSTDLYVKATASPSGSVVIYSGTAIIPSTYPGANNQSYTLSNDAAFSLPVAANSTGSPITWNVVVWVKDPQYPGETVAATEAVMVQYPEALSRPYYRLARIVVPAGTSVITQAMITDTREMAIPRRKRVTQTYQNISTSGETATLTGAYEGFPDGARWDIDVPAWATKFVVAATWGQLRLSGTNFSGYLRLAATDGSGNNVYSHLSGIDTPSGGGTQRTTYVCLDTVSIPAVLRGKSVQFILTSQKTAGSNAGAPIFDWGSVAQIDLEFLEAAEQD